MVQKVIESDEERSDELDNDESNYDPSFDNKKKPKHGKVKASRKLLRKLSSQLFYFCLISIFLFPN